MPPSMNIYIRYMDGVASRKIEGSGFKSRKLNTPSSAEATYQSFTIEGIPSDYSAEDVTPHDFLLRMSLDENGQVQLYKQTV